MEYPQNQNLQVVVLLFMLHFTGIHASILYPTDGHTVVVDQLINAKDIFIANTNGTMIFGERYYQGHVDKKGGIYTSTPNLPTVYIDSWYNCELNFVKHPTGDLLYGLVTDNALLARATDDVRTAFNHTTFNADLLVVVTYANYTSDGSANPPMNIFQTVLIIGYSETYVELNYPPEEMGWWQDSSGNYPTMRFSYNDEVIMTIPSSGTADIKDVILKGNIPNLPGRWMFRIDGTCPTCLNSKGAYMLSCVNGNTTMCLCSRCDSGSPDDEGLSPEMINILISVLVIGGLAVIATITGVLLYYKKHQKK